MTSNERTEAVNTGGLDNPHCFWVLERSDIPWREMAAGVTLYRSKRVGETWTPNIYHAAQWATREGAEVWWRSQEASDPALQAVEHAWIAPRPAESGDAVLTAERSEDGLPEDTLKALIALPDGGSRGELGGLSSQPCGEEGPTASLPPKPYFAEEGGDECYCDHCPRCRGSAR